MENQELKRSLGLGACVALIVGYVIGASIFILIGPIAFKTGPALWLTFWLASVPAIFMCFLSAQVGSALPVAGATYVLVSRTIGPFWGYMTVWCYSITTLIGIPLVAYGCADYLGFFVQGLSPMGAAVVITLIFGLINIFGVGLMGWVQNIMVLVFMAALIIFGVGGLFHINPENITPLMPNGFGAVIMAAIPAYFSFAGFWVIIELGEEVKNPAKTIPRAILIAFFVVLCTYTLVTFTLTSILPWESLENTQAAVAVAAGKFLPGWATALIAVGALFAAFTSINGILATSAREVFAMARDKVFPEWLARTNDRFRTPYTAIILITLLGVVGVLLGAGIVEYAFVTVMGIMAVTILMAIGVFRLKTRMPVIYEKSPYKLRGFWRFFWPIGAILVACVYILLGFVEAPVSVGLFFGAIALGGVAYFERRWRLKRKGIDIQEIFMKDVETIIEKVRKATMDE
jgi:APA family basic amino acid/polyamine antiporter